MINQFKKRFHNINPAAVTVGLSALTFGTFAMADGEGSEIPAMVIAGGVTMAAIASAVLAAYAGIKVFKLVRAAL